MHVDAADFALEDGLLPRNLGQGTILVQFMLLAEKAELGRKQILTGNTGMKILVTGFFSVRELKGLRMY